MDRLIIVIAFMFALGPACALTRRSGDAGLTAVKPITIEMDGRYEVRTFVVNRGETFTTKRGGSFTLVAIAETEVEIRRVFNGKWRLPSTRNPIGNHEYLDVVEVDRKRNQATFRVRTKTWLYPWELSF